MVLVAGLKECCSFEDLTSKWVRTITITFVVDVGVDVDVDAVFDQSIVLC